MKYKISIMNYCIIKFFSQTYYLFLYTEVHNLSFNKKLSIKNWSLATVKPLHHLMLHYINEIFFNGLF